MSTADTPLTKYHLGVSNETSTAGSHTQTHNARQQSQKADWLANKSIRDPPRYCAGLTIALVQQQRVNKRGLLQYNRQKCTFYTTDRNRWKYRKRVGLSLSQPLFASKNTKKAVRLVIKHPSSVFCQWSMRGSDREDGRQRENTDNKCAGFFIFFRISFCWFEFRKKKRRHTGSSELLMYIWWVTPTQQCCSDRTSDVPSSLSGMPSCIFIVV